MAILKQSEPLGLNSKRDENWESERAQLIAACDEAKQSLNDMQDAVTLALERQVRTAIEQVRSELGAENDKLRKELENRRSEDDRRTVAASAAAEFVREEVTRVEAAIREITAEIEDPEAELSVVVRKNVLKAQMDAYLKGLRFAVATRD